MHTDTCRRNKTALLGYILLASLLLTLAGCGTFSERGGSSTRADGPRAGAPTSGGGYYLDDGPGSDAPANLDAIADPVPRLERLNQTTGRPYSVLGRSYAPMTELAPYRERGMASWYGKRYHGKRTSSGELYDMYAMTAAHTTLPIPSYVRVTNLDNERSVIVRINDRGPFVGDRLIDLSYVAAHKLGIVRNGAAPVEVETILPTSESAAEPTPIAPPIRTDAPNSSPNTGPPAEFEQPASFITADNGHFLQLAAFTVKDNAERFAERVRGHLEAIGTQIWIVPAGALYRIQTGPYANRSAAEQAAQRIEALLGTVPIITAPR
jgi:rare lipoprotein A